MRSSGRGCSMITQELKCRLSRKQQRCSVGFLLAALVLFWILAGPFPSNAQASAAAVTTDRTGYLAGETVTITGSGFAPLETVTLHVVHAGGGEEAGMGHDPWVAVADDAGSLAATWSINPDD